MKTTPRKKSTSLAELFEGRKVPEKTLAAIEEMVERMQTPEVLEAARRACNATPKEMGRFAVKAAQAAREKNVRSED